ncbi:hypothetical protein [Neobacillus niacini]|uniref:hypothetical protein n=1 Tax=Neobacillus niacini TaxID=86668 RepID=UPI0020402D75|nr:hypothetical protein [Neobacillus niacini]
MQNKRDTEAAASVFLRATKQAKYDCDMPRFPWKYLLKPNEITRITQMRVSGILINI